MLKISAVYLIGKAEIPIHYTTMSQVEQALLIALIMDMPRSKTRFQIQKCRFFGGRGRSLGKAQRFPASRGDLA